VPGSVTAQEQFGDTASVNTIFLRGSVKLFVPLILNTACVQTFTVCVSFHIFQSKSAGFASNLSICIDGEIN
jgi:hypothetical protein